VAPSQILGLAEQFDQLYQRARRRVGDQDLAHIRNVAEYSKAIEVRSQQLLAAPAGRGSFERGVTLGMLHTLLEFSELGHAIYHGGYDHLPDAGVFHSDRWQWDFVTDPREWKVMHHQNHHPFTNIVGVDHDIGYSFLRLKPGQSWYPHNSVQPITFAALMSCHLYYFAIYTATSAARTEGRKILSRDTFAAAAQLIFKHVKRRYWQLPRRAGRHFLRSALGNYLSTAAGYDLTIAVLLLEHHAANVQLFHDPGPTESRDAWCARQLLATTNFIGMPQLDAYLQRILREEVPFTNRPDFSVFYGGLDTHLEHHLFPDLPPLRQREITEAVRSICEARGLPYNVVSLERALPSMVVDFLKWIAPIGEKEQGISRLLARPRELVRRLVQGSRYESANETYMAAPVMFNVQATILDDESLGGGIARRFRIARPSGWDNITWGAGAFISVRTEVAGQVLVRQYSLLRESTAANPTDIEFCVKRVHAGRVSNQLNDQLRTGKTVTLVGPPTSEGTFILQEVPRRLLLIAGGVGVTPMLAMLRRVRATASRSDVTLLYFNRDQNSILFAEQLRTLTTDECRVHFFVDKVATPSDARTNSHHWVQQGQLSGRLLDQYAGLVSTAQVYVCAPPEVVQIAHDLLVERGMPTAAFHTESFTAPSIASLRKIGDSSRQHVVRFRKSKTQITVDGATTLLEAAREAGIAVATGCERGLCKACVSVKLNGRTQHDDGAAAFLPRITVCNSLPRSDVELDL
jgi:stearoyl-CoA 9-desaturase NADPH oxidoreductase